MSDNTALLAEVQQAQVTASVLRQRIETEYSMHAAALADLLKDLLDFENHRADLRRRAVAASITTEIPGAEDFRHPSWQWFVSYPTPDGSGTIQTTAKRVPPGLINWNGDIPAPASDNVKVWCRPAMYQGKLHRAIKYLPGILPEDPPFFLNSSADAH